MLCSIFAFADQPIGMMMLIYTDIVQGMYLNIHYIACAVNAANGSAAASVLAKP